MQADTISSMAGSVSSITKDAGSEYSMNAKSVSQNSSFKDVLNKSAQGSSGVCQVQNNTQTGSTNNKYESSVKNSTNDNSDCSGVKKTAKNASKDKSKIKNSSKDSAKVKDDDIKDASSNKKMADSLLNMLFQILNLNGSITNFAQFEKNFENSPDKLSYLNKICKGLNIGDDALADMLKNSIAQGNAGTISNEILNALKSDAPDSDIFKFILNYSSKNLNSSAAKDDKQNAMLGRIKKMISPLLEKSNQNTAVNQDSKNGAMNDSKEGNTGKAQVNGDSILEKLTENKDSKIDKVTNFMSMLKASDAENENVLSQNVVVNKATLPSDIIKAVKYMESSNIKNLTVKIQPKELGELYIKVTMENGALKASVSASNKDAYNVLNANLLDIQNKLSDSGIKIQNFTLNAYEDPTYFSNDSGRENHESERGSKNKRSAESFNGIEAADDDKNYAKLSNNINLFA